MSPNKAVCEKYMQRLLIDMVEAQALDLLKEELKIDDEDSDSILKQLVRGLSKDAKQFFKEVIDEGIFAENTREFEECFQFKLVSASIEQTVDNPQLPNK